MTGPLFDPLTGVGALDEQADARPCTRCGGVATGATGTDLSEMRICARCRLAEGECVCEPGSAPAGERERT